MKPKYSFFNNAKYAFYGIQSLLKEEIAFRIELFIIIPALILDICLNQFFTITLLEQFFLAFVLFLILITEALNSAIEACVDLATQEWKMFAKKAKDCASAAVFFSILFAFIVWSVTFYKLVTT